MAKMHKFKRGDKVCKSWDTANEKVGKIVKVDDEDDSLTYYVSFPSCSSWFSEEELRLAD